MPDFDQLKNFVIAKKPTNVFSKTINSLKGLFATVGMPVDNVGDIAQHGGSWKGLWEKVRSKGLEKLGLEELASVGLAYGSNLVLPGSGLVAGSALTAGSMLHSTKNSFKKGKKPSQQGEWVLIDNGPERLKRKTKRAIAWGEAAMFGDTPGEADFSIDVEEVISIGFFIQNGAANETFQIFNFETKEVEERVRDEIVVMPPTKVLEIDAHPTLSKIRQIILLQHTSRPQGSTLKGAVNVDPGAEVVYKGEAYRVVSSVQDVVKISNEKQSLDVSYGLLTPGRTKHSSGWNYGSTPAGPGFQKDGNPTYHANQWVWLSPPRQSAVRDAKDRFDVNRELGVLRLINGDVLDGYYALDGIRFQRQKSNVRPASRSEKGWLSLDKDFVRFKDAAVSGEGTRRLRLGGEYLGVCLGKVLTMEAPVLDFAQEFTDEGQVAGKSQVLVAGTPKDPVDGTAGQKAKNELDTREAFVGKSRAPQAKESQFLVDTPIVLVTVGVLGVFALMYFG